MLDARLFHLPVKPLAAVLLTTAALVTTPAIATSVDDINQEINTCTREHGYSPRQAANLDANKLGENERAFLDCVYGGIESNLVPKAFFPEDYKYLIKRYREMTDAVEQGELTRQQRTAEAQQILDIMKDKEVKETNKRINDLSGKREWLLKQRESMLKRSPKPF